MNEAINDKESGKMTDSKHVPWSAGSQTKAILNTRADAERFAHLTYGELVKHFGLGSTHTFSSWGDLPEDERAKWIAALAEVQTELQSSEARPAEGQAH
jgi:hypothetical protein